MRLIEGYDHQIASHCETGSARNLLRHAGLDIDSRVTDFEQPRILGVGVLVGVNRGP